MKNKTPDLPTQSLIYFLICGAGILVFVLLIIVPTQRTAAELDQEIERLSARIEEQKLLKPVFDSLLDRVRRNDPIELPVVKKDKLAFGEIDQITESLQQNARQHNLKIEDMQTDMNALSAKAGNIVVQIKINGEFQKFRDFLMDLGKIPSLERIDEIHIRAIENSRQLTVKVRLALAMKS